MNNQFNCYVQYSIMDFSIKCVYAIIYLKSDPPNQFVGERTKQSKSLMVHTSVVPIDILMRPDFQVALHSSA